MLYASSPTVAASPFRDSSPPACLRIASSAMSVRSLSSSTSRLVTPSRPSGRHLGRPRSLPTLPGRYLPAPTRGGGACSPTGMTQSGRRRGDALVGRRERHPHVPLPGRTVERAGGDQDAEAGQPVDRHPGRLVEGAPQVEA